MAVFSYVAVVIDTDGSAFITKAEFDSLKNNFQAQIDNYNTSIDSKIDGAIAAYLAGIKMSATQTIYPTFVVPGIIGMSGSNNTIMQRTKTRFIDINCLATCVYVGATLNQYYGLFLGEIKSLAGKDYTYRCRLVDEINNSSTTTKKHALWLGYQTGKMLVAGSCDQSGSLTMVDNGKSWALSSVDFTNQSFKLAQAWGWVISRGVETNKWGGFWISDLSGYMNNDPSVLQSQTPRPYGSATSSLRHYAITFSDYTTRSHTYTLINKPYVTQYDTNSPKVENKDGYEWFCNDGGDEDWTSSYLPFSVNRLYAGNNSNPGAGSGWYLVSGGSPTYEKISLKFTDYPTSWTNGHFYGCPYKGYNENITTMDDLYDTDYTTFIPNLTTTNNCKSSEQYSVSGQQVWCLSMGFPLTKIQSSGTLEIEFNRNAGNNDYVVRLCKGAQSKDYAYNTDIQYAVKTDLNGTPYDAKFGGFVLSGSNKKIKFDVDKNDIITLKVIPLNTAKTAFSGYVELKPIESMVLVANT